MKNDKLLQDCDDLKEENSSYQILINLKCNIQDKQERECMAICLASHINQPENEKKFLNTAANQLRKFFKIIYPEISIEQEPVVVNGFLLSHLGDFNDSYEIIKWEGGDSKTLLESIFIRPSHLISNDIKLEVISILPIFDSFINALGQEAIEYFEQHGYLDII